MQSVELERLQDWRFCNVKHLDKIPYPNNWQNTPLQLSQVTSSNLGVILGVHSNGLCAIDFDGTEAIDHWTETFNIDIASLDTVMWTSGKDYRCQAAFTIDNEYWDVLKRKVVNKLEFRWNCQSVLPPSKLSDGREYIWLKSPIDYKVQKLPEPVLKYWLQLIYDDMEPTEVKDIKAYPIEKYDEQFIDELLSHIQPRVGNLRGDYDVWRTIAWAVCSQLGTSVARHLMTKYWPDKTKKEHKTINSWRPTHRGPGIGTLIKLSGINTMEIKLMQVRNKLQQLKRK